ILFREECLFKREIRLGDQVDLLVRLSKARADGSCWSFRNEFMRKDGQLCAVLNVEGAWIDTQKRKIAILPAELMHRFLDLPHSADVELLAPSASRS
nr:thioesterase family protein [Flavobacteriales bacterium]